MVEAKNNLPSLVEGQTSSDLVESSEIQFLQVTIAGDVYGVAIHQLNDVVNFKTIHKIPTAPDEVLGLVNLHGRIVTVLDISQVLSSKGESFDRNQKTNPDNNQDNTKELTAMTVNHKGDMLALVVDKVSDVIAFPYSEVKKIPTKSRSLLHLYCTGFVEINDNLVLLIDVIKIIEQFISDNNNLPGLAIESHIGIDSKLFENPL